MDTEKETNVAAMDTEKEKTTPDNGSINGKNDDHDQHDHHDKDQEPSKTTTISTDNPLPLSEPSTEDNESKSDNNIAEEIPKKEIQEPEEQAADDINGAEEPEPSALPPDLGKVSEEIDEYISTLSNSISKGDDESPLPDVPIVVEQFALLVEDKVENNDSRDSHVKWSTQLTDEDASSFLEAVVRMFKLSNALCQLSSEEKYAPSINRIGGVLERAMSYLEEEFKSLLENHRVLIDHHAYHSNDSKSKQSSSSVSNEDASDQSSVPETDHQAVEENNFPGYTEEVVSQLSRLAKLLILGGHETECCQIYFIARRNALEESLNKLGFQKHSIDDLHKMNWESLEREIVAWNKTFKQCATVHFSNEHKLSDSVFKDYPSLSLSLFSNLSRGIMIQLLDFYEAVAMTRRAAEKLFKFLDIYESLRDLLPRMEDLLIPECADELKTEASLTRGRLGEAMISIFCELENSIKTDNGKTPVPGGAVHPLTRYTMNYLKYACEYTDTLEQIFREHQKIERAESSTISELDFDHNNNSQAGENHNSNNNNNNNNNGKTQSPFEVQIVKVMDLLDSNIEAKSKLYRDTSLSMIFLMNNGRYILQKIKGSSEISSLLGDTWSRKRSSELRQYHKNYQRETWGKLLNFLINHEGLNVNGKVVKPVLKERFKSFNAMFEEIHKNQSGWVISDEQLQSELRVSISNMVVPAYRSFMARFSQHLTPGRQTEKYIKFQPEDVESYIDELFDGNAAAPILDRPS